MPILKNARHERFCQELAKGKSATKAYDVVGFKPNRHNAATLARKQHIITRLAEIMDQLVKFEQKAVEKATERLSIDKEWVLGALVEDRLQAKAEKQTGSAIRALELIGKELRMFIDRKEVGLPGEFVALESMTPDELRAFIAERAASGSVCEDEADEAGGMRAAGEPIH